MTLRPPSLAVLAGVVSLALAAGAAVATAAKPSAQIVEQRPAEVSTVFRNPHMGWLIYAFRPISHPSMAQTTPVASTVYTNYFTWAELEPVEGLYRWDLIDRFLRAWPGRQVRLGIRATGPVRLFGAEPLPAWLRKQIGGGYYTSPSTWEPQYTNPIFLQQHAEFLRALAHRYYDTPRGGVDWRRRIESFDIDTYGMWGEWWSRYDFADRGVALSPEADVRYDTLKRLVDNYFDAFSGQPRPELTMNVIGSSFYEPSLDAGDPAAVRYAVDRGATTVRRAMGMSLPADERQFIRSHLDSRSLQTEWVSPDGVIAWLRPPDRNRPWTTTWEAIDQALSLGANYLGWYVAAQTVRCSQIPKDLPLGELPEMARCGANGTTSVTAHPLAKLYPGTHETLEDYFQRRAGYRFYVSRFAYPASVAAGRRFALDQTWWQRGVGKLHSRYYLRARLTGRATVRLNVDGGLSAERWPAGPSGPHAITSRFAVPAATRPGRYTLELAVVGTDGKPAINLADSGKDTKGLADPRNDYGWYRVGPITITR
jgi:hypothetical protein